MTKRTRQDLEGMCYSVTLEFERTFLPPFRDILVVGKSCSLGANGLARSLELLVPNGYAMHQVDHPDVAAFVVNRSLLKRLSEEKIRSILESRVFPYMDKSEIIKVDLTVTVRYEAFDVEP